MRAGWFQAIEVRRHVAAAAAILVACALVATAGGAVAAESTIKVCKDANGKPVAADRTDPRCFKAPLTPDEEAAVNERKRRENDAYRACKIEQRDLQTLLSRYPNKEKHDAARRAALGELESSMAASQTRMEQLLKERKRLLEEAEFYPKGNLPAKLRRDIDTNSALIAAQTQAIENQKEEAARKNAFYDEQLVKLKRLWLARPADLLPCVAPRD
jgi:hypothetical protein